MSGNFIINTPRHRMHALAFQGIMVTDCHLQLQDMLRKQLGETHVLLFAQPVPNTGDQSIDWYTPVQGTVRPLSSLPQEEQHTLREQLLHMGQELLSLAKTLKKSPEHTKNTRGMLLELALRYPDDDCLFVVGEQPIITCWGFGPGTPGAEPQELWRPAQLSPSTAVTAPDPAPQSAPLPPVLPPPPVMEAPVAPRPHKRSLQWLWWLLPLFLLGVLIWLLLTAFGPRPALSGLPLFHAPLPPFCTTGENLQDRLAVRKRELAMLETELAALHTRLDSHVAQCRPKQDAAPEQALVIPKEPRNMAFLQGQWRCETDLVNRRTREPIVVEFSFDGNGAGTGQVFEKKRRCTGAAQGKLTEEGTLRITLAEQNCGNGAVYERQEILCRDINGVAHCQGQNADGSSWNARFLKKP